MKPDPGDKRLVLEDDAVRRVIGGNVVDPTSQHNVHRVCGVTELVEEIAFWPLITRIMI